MGVDFGADAMADSNPMDDQEKPQSMPTTTSIRKWIAVFDLLLAPAATTALQQRCGVRSMPKPGFLTNLANSANWKIESAGYARMNRII
jgi:hypothetical protein